MTQFTMSFESHSYEEALMNAYTHKDRFYCANTSWLVERSPVAFPDVYWHEVFGLHIDAYATVLARGAGLSLALPWLWLQPYQASCTIAGVSLRRIGVSSETQCLLSQSYNEEGLGRNAQLLCPHPSHFFFSIPEDYALETRPLHHIGGESLLTEYLVMDRESKQWRQEACYLESLLLGQVSDFSGVWASGRTQNSMPALSLPEFWSNGCMEAGLRSTVSLSVETQTAEEAIAKVRGHSFYLSYYTSTLWSQSEQEAMPESMEALLVQALRRGQVRAIYLPSQLSGASWILRPDRWWRRFTASCRRSFLSSL